MVGGEETCPEREKVQKKEDERSELKRTSARPEGGKKPGICESCVQRMTTKDKAAGRVSLLTQKASDEGNQLNKSSKGKR